MGETKRDAEWHARTLIKAMCDAEPDAESDDGYFERSVAAMAHAFRCYATAEREQGDRLRERMEMAVERHELEMGIRGAPDWQHGPGSKTRVDILRVVLKEFRALLSDPTTPEDNGNG